MLTYVFFIKRDYLWLKLFNNRKRSEVSLRRRMSPERLAQLQLPTKSRKADPERAMLKNYEIILNGIRSRLAHDGEEDMDIRRIAEIFKIEVGLIEEDTRGEFVIWYEKFMSTKTNEGTKGVYKHTLDKMHSVDPDLDRRKFEDINLAWLERFEAECAKTASKNARNIHLRNIRAVFNYAIDHEATTAYPFRRFKIRPEETRKRSLSVEELRKLMTCMVEPYAEIYRDMFVLIFLLIGINTVDLYNLKEIESDRINYRRAKTRRLYSIKVEPEAMALIEKYRGVKNLLCLADRWSDHRNFRHQTNKALQLIGAERNKGGRVKGGAPKRTDKEDRQKGYWPELTTYWARHTWATIAADLDIPDATISLALGHSAENATTAIYIRRNLKKVDEANRRVLDYVLYGKR